MATVWPAWALPQTTARPPCLRTACIACIITAGTPVASTAKSAPPGMISAIFLTGSSREASTVWVAPQLGGEFEFLGVHVHRYDGNTARNDRAQNGRKPDAARAENRDRLARPRLADIQHRAHAGR